MLVTLAELLPLYLDRDAAVGAFNATVYADAEPVISAAERMKAPVIVQLGSYATSAMDIGLWGLLLGEMARRSSVPVCLHLDHATRIDEIQKAIDSGFSSVMIDGSQLSYEGNVEITREVVARAKKRGVSVEAEIGSVAYSGSASHKAELTDPDIAARFAEDTGVDAVAVAVGTLHRMQKQASHIDFELLARIGEKVTIPLVIHGSTGLVDEDLVKVRSTRVCKVNIGTALRVAFDRALRESLAENPDNHVITQLLGKPRRAVEDVVLGKLSLLGFGPSLR
jgi:fructose-bisphosphate aldolase class II